MKEVDVDVLNNLAEKYKVYDLISGDKHRSIFLENGKVLVQSMELLPESAYRKQQY